jgi:hypothetical protein
VRRVVEGCSEELGVELEGRLGFDVSWISLV